MKTDDAKRAILARRASFVAAAIAGTISCGKTTAERKADPRPCLSVAVPFDDAGPPPALSEVTPAPTLGTARPCLSIASPRRDAGRAPCPPGDPLCSDDGG